MTDKKEDITEYLHGLVDEMKYDLEDDESLWGKDNFDPEAFEKEIAATKILDKSNIVTVPPEFSHILKVLQMGIDKGYKANGWLNDPESPRMSHKENHDSMFHHLAESFAGVTNDKDSGLHPLLHLATRALMGYTRYMRDIESERE